MGESMWRRTVTELSSYPTELDARADRCRPCADLASWTTVDVSRSSLKMTGAGCAGVVALASFSAVDETTAEVAVVVQDDWQRQGVGTALVSTLLDAAEKRGFDRFVATIAADNSIIRRLLDRFGRVVASHTSLGVSELVFVRRRSWETPCLDRRRAMASRARRTRGFRR